ncbi:unnamed protein product, partial [Pocillopora meandrina]
VHVTSLSNVADHCVLFALSDSSDADYQQQCSHQHTHLCGRCQSLQETLAKIERGFLHIIQSCNQGSAAVVKIMQDRIDFSDPQGGKGAADRLAATCKNHVRTFINEGNDVTNAEQLKSALLSHRGVEGVRV